MIGVTGMGGEALGRVGFDARNLRTSLRTRTMVTPVEPMFFCAPACDMPFSQLASCLKTREA